MTTNQPPLATSLFVSKASLHVCTVSSMIELPRRSRWSKFLTFALVLFLMVTDASSSSPSTSILGAASLRDSTAETETETLPDSPKTISNVVVRFYLIRHGETQANEEGLVLGQTDSVR